MPGRARTHVCHMVEIYSTEPIGFNLLFCLFSSTLATDKPTYNYC